MIVSHFGLTPNDPVLQFAALSFGVALEEVVPTLLSSATLVLRRDEVAQSVLAFSDQLDTLGITVTNLPTDFWVTLTSVLESQNSVFPANIMLVIVFGEGVPIGRALTHPHPRVWVLSADGISATDASSTSFCDRMAANTGWQDRCCLPAAT